MNSGRSCGISRKLSTRGNTNPFLRSEKISVDRDRLQVTLTAYPLTRSIALLIEEEIECDGSVINLAPAGQTKLVLTEDRSVSVFVTPLKDIDVCALGIGASCEQPNQFIVRVYETDGFVNRNQIGEVYYPATIKQTDMLPAGTASIAVAKERGTYHPVRYRRLRHRGVYFLKLSTPTNGVTRKFVVNHQVHLFTASNSAFTDAQYCAALHRTG